MNEALPPVLPDVQTRPRMSLGARLTNVFIAPGEVFEEVKQSPPSLANWLVPALLLCLVGVVSAFVIFSQDSIMQQIREQQERAISKRLEKMPKEQRDQVVEAMQKWSGAGLMKVVGSVTAVGRSFGWLFVTAVLLWLLGTRVFKGTFTYMHAVEVTGLATMISVLGGIISMLLVVVMGSTLASPGPALLVHDLNPSNLLHLTLAAINVMTLWYLGVLAIGLSKLSGATVGKAAAWLFGLWAIFTMGLVLLGWGAQKLSSVYNS